MVPLATTTVRPATARKTAFRHTLPAVLRDPLRAFERIAREADGEIIRLDLGLFRPYLVTAPEHVQRVLRDNHANYAREGMFWRPLRRLLGDGILADGPTWQTSRRLIQPLFTAKHIDSLLDRMARAIGEAVDGLEPYARTGEPVDATAEMTRLVHRAVSRIFFGNRLSPADFERLAPAIDTAATSIGARMLMPFLPDWIPVPGDGAFRRAVRTIDDVMLPVIEQARSGGDPDSDIVAMLCHARTEDGHRLSDRAVRDDVVSMFAAGTETTAVTLTWLWVALADHPGIAARLRDEVRVAVGPGPVVASDLPNLRYTRMVLQELIRVYTPGWIVPRTATNVDYLGGVRIEPGATILISPYLTHRLDRLWDRPTDFDPERFAPGHSLPRHRFAYFPFGGGPHQCIGAHFFLAEAQFMVANVLSRFHPVILNRTPITAQAAASLRPRQRVEMALSPASAR
jgi:cytochrome P450